MTPFQAWFDSKTAVTAEAAGAGDGCHPDETQALKDYLSDQIPAEEAARRITTPILNETDPSQEVSRLWGLLCEALVELSAEHRNKTLDLLPRIQALPPAPGIQWAQLPGFASMWDTLYRLHLHGPDPWEKDIGSFDEAKSNVFRRDFEAIGRAEAEMFVRGFDVVVDEDWGYRVLSLVCLDRSGLEYFISEVFAWLDVAGPKLKEKLIRPSADGDHSQSANGTRAEQWITWKEALLGLSRQESRLSETGRGLASQCHALM